MAKGNNDQIFFGNITEKEINGNSGPYKLTKLSFKIEEAMQHKNAKGYVNLLLKENRAGKKYLVVDTWKPSGGGGGGRGGAQDYDESNDYGSNDEDNDLNFDD